MSTHSKNFGLIQLCLTVCLLGNFSRFFCCLLFLFFQDKNSQKKLRNTIKVSKKRVKVQIRPTKSLPDLGPNCLQKLSADNSSRLRVDRSSILI